jgi:hypothetical protein
MKSALLVVSLNIAIITFGLSLASAKSPPSSAEQLRSAVESSLKTKDTNSFKALFNWQGVSESMKAEMNDENAEVFNHDIDTVRLVALPADFQLTNELDGVSYRPNVKVLGLVDVEYTEKGNAISMPYGTMGGAFYISSTVEEKTATPATEEKNLNINVMGSAAPDSGTFTGSYSYVKGGKEITNSISGKGNGSEAFLGDYIKRCTVQKASDRQEWIKLVILEDGKKVFESEKVTNGVPVVYEKK